MALPKVGDTIQLRGKYHVKIRVPDAIQKHWDGKAVHQKSLKTSDPKAAEKEVRAIRAIMDAQLDKEKAEESWKALSRNLPPDQKALLEAAGGLSELVGEFERGKQALAFIRAGKPSEGVLVDFEDGPNGEPVPIIVEQSVNAEELEVERAIHDAELRARRGQINARGRVLRKLGEAIELDGDVFSLRDVVEKWAPTVDAQTADTARYYVRRFTELYGEIALVDLRTEHLRDFAEEIKGLPVVTSAKVTDGRHVRDLHFREAVEWANRNAKETLSDKTREKYVSILKRLLGFAAEQVYRKDNPWAHYKIPREKQKHSAKAKSDRRPFTAEEVMRILDYISGSNDPKFGKTTIRLLGAVDFSTSWNEASRDVPVAALRFRGSRRRMVYADHRRRRRNAGQEQRDSSLGSCAP